MPETPNNLLFKQVLSCILNHSAQLCTGVASQEQEQSINRSRHRRIGRSGVFTSSGEGKGIYILVLVPCASSWVKAGRSVKLYWLHFIVLKIKMTGSSLSVLWVNEVFCHFREMPRQTQKTAFLENDSGCSHEGVGWLVWGCGRQLVAGRFVARATGNISPPFPWSLCSWPTYAKPLAPLLFFLKAFLICPFPVEQRFIVLQRTCLSFPERKKGGRDGRALMD